MIVNIARKMLHRTAVALCLILALSFGFATNAYAQNVRTVDGNITDSKHNPGDLVEIAPFWQHIATINVHLTIDNGRAVMTGRVIGNPGTQSITGTAVLERINPNGTTTHIATFSNLHGSGNIWAWERAHMVARGHQYRFTLTATAVRNGTSETVSLSSHTVWAH